MDLGGDKGELSGNKYNGNTLHGILMELLKIFNNNPKQQQQKPASGSWCL